MSYGGGPCLLLGKLIRSALTGKAAIEMADPYNTNLAAEFYVLSMLHRLGAEAALTLGNKKAVDILVVRGDGRTITIDVKGVAKRWDWPADNFRKEKDPRHFMVLVSFEGKIRDSRVPPNVWIIPAKKVPPFLRKYTTRTVICRAAVQDKGKLFREAWHLVAK